MIELTKSYVGIPAEHLGPASGAAIEALVVGIIATFATDLWQRLLQAIAVLPPANWRLVGRWVACFPRGNFVHRPITATPSVRGKVAIGWAFHYAVGIVYAALYLAIMRLGFGSGPTLISALAFAIAMPVAPWFVMQPSAPSMCPCTPFLDWASTRRSCVAGRRGSSGPAANAVARGLRVFEIRLGITKQLAPAGSALEAFAGAGSLSAPTAQIAE
jgi:hypothetical protein